MSERTKPDKPLGHKSYGSIPHLPGSKVGPGDYTIHEGQARILTEKPRKGDTVIVTVKLDGTNVSIAKIDGKIVPLMRAGYRAIDSRFEMHHMFHDWVMARADMFDAYMVNGERICGEWMAQAHGIRYEINKTPFYAFDLMVGKERMPRAGFVERVGDFGGDIYPVPLVKKGRFGVSVDTAWEYTTIAELTPHPIDVQHEGLVYRVENDRGVDFLAKWVRPDFEPGIYLPGLDSNNAIEPTWNWRPR